jgi:hypothetical protein
MVQADGAINVLNNSSRMSFPMVNNTRDRRGNARGDVSEDGRVSIKKMFFGGASAEERFSW